jgi:ubiquinone biosynthesis protein COQ9
MTSKKPLKNILYTKSDKSKSNEISDKAIWLSENSIHLVPKEDYNKWVEYYKDRGDLVMSNAVSEEEIKNRVGMDENKRERKGYKSGEKENKCSK